MHTGMNFIDKTNTANPRWYAEVQANIGYLGWLCKDRDIYQACCNLLNNTSALEAIVDPYADMEPEMAARRVMRDLFYPKFRS
jgi:hypothetical protein